MQEQQKNAIEHLGHKSVTVRISGARELFHLAKDSRDLRQDALDILFAHIRQMTTSQTKRKIKPSEEIQSLLKLLFIDEHDVLEDYSIDLQGSYLSGAKLSKARLQGANLREARLQGADLSEAQLQKADLKEARLQVANLSKAQLQGADLREARLQVADLTKAQLQKADLTKAQLQGANHREAQLQGVSSWAHSLLSSLLSEGFKSRIGKLSDRKKINFSGELQQKDLNALCEGLSAEKAQKLRETLGSYVEKPASHESPADSGAKTGAYTQKNDTANAPSAPDSDKGD